VNAGQERRPADLDGVGGLDADLAVLGIVVSYAGVRMAPVVRLSTVSCAAWM
jgi:hypothetical protein